MSTYIHPTAVVEPGASLGVDCDIQAHAVITRHAILEDGVVVHPGAVVGGDPQYLRFDRSTPSFARIGKGTVLREHVTVNRAIHADHTTVVGEGCFLMAAAHVAHDCVLGKNVVLANNALLAGHVSIGDFAFIGGGAAIHQYVRVGESVMLGGLARITRDLAPYTIVAERDEVSGLNLVGLKRRGFTRETLAELKKAFREVYFSNGKITTVASGALGSGDYHSSEARAFLEFFLSGKRGFARSPRRNVEGASEE